MMTEQEWLSSTDPRALLCWILPDGELSGRALAGITDRKLRLFMEAVNCSLCLEATKSDTPAQAALYCAAADCHTFAHKAALLRCLFGNPWRPGPQCRCDSSISPHDAIRCPLSAWTPDTVMQLAQSIYDTRDWAALPVLADALEEAGCTSAGLLAHLRGIERCPVCLGRGTPDVLFNAGGTPTPCKGCHNRSGAIPLRGPHARGCHALDLILGKE